MIDQLGGRKLLAGAVILLVGLGITIGLGDIPANLLSLLQVVFGAFVLGNGIEHVAGAVKREPEAAPVETPAEPQLAIQHAPEANPAFDEILTNTREIREAVATTQQGMSVILQIAMGANRTPPPQSDT